MALLKERLEDPPLAAIVGGHSFQDHTAYRQAALARAAELGVSMKTDIIQLGTVSDLVLVEWYHSADAFLFPSVKEGWGLVAMEALAVGLPLIATDIPVFREYLADGETALLVPPGDSGALADVMQRVMEDEGVRKSLADAGPEVARRFTWHRAATDHERLYREMALRR
jgi:glycosyltransferase involved in cell wall biosynthesis